MPEAEPNFEALDAVIQSKEAVGREKDRAVLPTLRRLREEINAEARRIDDRDDQD